MASGKEPSWLKLARELVGLKEIVGSQHEAKVLAFYAEAGHPWVKDDETAWCAAFVNAMLRRAGYKGTGSLAARSFLQWGEKLDTPRPGCIVVFKRGNSAWQGHVAFFLSESATHVKVLGGNQGNAVSVANYPKKTVLGYRWPAGAGKAAQPIRPKKPPAPKAVHPPPANDDPAAETQAPDAADPATWPADVQLPDFMRRARPDGQILGVQKVLKALGYHEVGDLDGEWGGRTAGAIAAYKNDRHLAGMPEIDEDLLADLRAATEAGWRRPIARKRSEADAGKAAQKIDTVNQTWWSRLWAKVVAIPTLLVAAWGWVTENFDGVRAHAQPLFDTLGVVPWWLWVAGIGGAAVAIWISQRKAEQSVVDAVRDGRIA
jgi:uncharacterized protein (TIGR02594 family)